MKKIKYIIYVFIVNILFLPFSAQSDDASSAWKEAYKSTVIVLPTWPGYNRPGFGAPLGTAPAGTGFYVSVDNKSDNTYFIMTAAHVIKNAKVVDIKDYKNITQQAEVVLVDLKRDIAILRSKVNGLAIKTSQRNIDIGNEVCVIGNSFGLGPSLSCGIISAKNRKNLGFNQIENFIQTDAAVNPGASGAPLVNKMGELIGMIDAIYTKEADIDAGVNFAIDKELINKFITENYDLLIKN
ncbi:trypsin-like peptidase domain-containing protein [Alphaproteobacteria bacterium]|nr:trypsin-like peptidase domain-containing protein [Alphaproteobacteria bacterium]